MPTNVQILKFPQLLNIIIKMVNLHYLQLAEQKHLNHLSLKIDESELPPALSVDSKGIIFSEITSVEYLLIPSLSVYSLLLNLPST